MSKFKVGQKVRCIENQNGRTVPRRIREIEGAGWKKGREFIIGRIFSSIDVGFLILPASGAGVFEDFLELVEKEVKVYGIVKFMNSINKKE